jgi:hypothetical protein
MKRASHFLLVEAERYRHLAERTGNEEMAALWRRVVSQYEDLARRHDEYCGLGSFVLSPFSEAANMP